MPNHQDLARRRANLSEQQRAELQRRLKGLAPASPQRQQIPRRVAGARAPLSSAQQRLWFLWKLDPASTAYHLSGGLKFSGPLDAQALQDSLADLVERHASLRTVFAEGADGAAEQVVLPAPEVGLARVDLQAVGGPAPAERVLAEAERLCGTPFDLARGPLLRAALLQTGAGEHVLLVAMHHIISDGQSTQIILDELAACYRARRKGGAPQLADLPVGYADHAAWQREWLQGPQSAQQLAWWRSRLASAEMPVLALQTDRPRRADGRYGMAWHAVPLPVGLVQRLKARAATEGATLFVALLAAFEVLLQRHTGLGDVRVGVPVANRNRPELAGLVGFFVNTLVMRAGIEERMVLGQVLAHVRDAAFDAQAHQELPFERVVEALQPVRSLGTTPLFQVMFNHLRRDERFTRDWPDLQVERLDVAAGGAQFELVLETCEDQAGRVEARFMYARELFEARRIERLANHYLAVLQALADDPQRAVGDVRLLENCERSELLRWGMGEACAASARPVHAQFEAHARAKPDAAALVFGEAELSYGELNARANRLAHRLIGLGVRPEVKVGVLAERSTELVVGLLAILKAGGAYVPLDPEYPADRLAYMAEDSGIGLLLA
ncbi:MAG: condensation domain-containing protein, partial [Comamonas sp.]